MSFIKLRSPLTLVAVAVSRRLAAANVYSHRLMSALQNNEQQRQTPFAPRQFASREVVFSCQNLAELASAAARLSLTADNAISVLRRAVDLTPAGIAPPETVQQLSGKTVEALLAPIHDSMHLLTFEQLDAVLTFCLKFRLPAESRFWQSIETQVRFIMPKMDINQVISSVKTFDQYVKTDSDNKEKPSETASVRALSDDLTKLLRERLAEITKPSDLLFALYKFSIASSAATARLTRDLNDRLVGCVARLTPKQLYRAFYVQTRLDSRHTPLLRAVTHFLRQPGQLDSLSPVHLLNVLFACASLRVTEPRLVKSVVGEVKKRYSSYSTSNLIAIARSVGSLQLNDSELMAKLVESGREAKNASLLADVIIAAGVTGIQLADDVKIDEIIVDNLMGFDKKNPLLWLKVVWSFFALGLNKKSPHVEQLVSSIFSDAFADDVITCSSAGKRLPEATLVKNPATRRVWLQAANIRELVRLEHPKLFEKVDCKGGKLALPDSLQDCPVRSERPQFDLCLNTFSGFCDVKKYVTTDRPTNGGACIDFVVYVDNAGELVPIESHVTPSEINNPSTHPVAIKVCEFAEQTLLETRPNGLAQLHARLFELLGYRTIVVTPEKLTRTMPIALRAHNLQEMIKQAISQ